MLMHRIKISLATWHGVELPKGLKLNGASMPSTYNPIGRECVVILVTIPKTIYTYTNYRAFDLAKYIRRRLRGKTEYVTLQLS